MATKMLDATLQIDPVRNLFEMYRERFDTENRLRPMSPDTDVLGLWGKLRHEMGVTAEQLTQQIAELTELPFQEGEIEPSAQLAARIPQKTLQRFHITPVAFQDNEPVIATANPMDPELNEALGFIFGSHYRLIVAAPELISRGIEAYRQHGTQPSGDKVTSQEIENTKLDDRAIPRLSRQLMARVLASKASDMHVQPFLSGFIVRARIDGLLQRITLLPDKVADAMIRYFKAQSGMDPTLNLVPQDGRMLVEIEDNQYDLRISTLPVTGHREKLVIRFLNRQSVRRLSDIGFSLDEIHAVQRLSKRPSGVALLCGPTGSGKTTTLYSVLNTLNSEDTSIMTVENPVEYQVQGLSQTEVNDKAGMTFPRALRAILRQDPDVLLIGEIRDEETAQIAMQAALTGHLVFSTLHTNDSLSAIPRLLDLGINPVILAESLAGIMSQRLLRTLCHHCRQPQQSITDPAAKAFQEVTRAAPGAHPVGCKQCGYSGYLGRTVVAEIVEINQAQRELLLGGESDIASFKQAMRGKFVSLFMAASRLIISGITSAEEASRVLGQQFWFALADEYGGELPDLSAIDNAGASKATSNAILISGPGSDSATSLQNGLTECWLTVYEAAEPAEAEQQLHAHENIDLVVVDLPEGLDDEEVVTLVADYRRHLAWSRLPALVRLPPDKAHWEALLRANGATSKFVSKESPIDEIISLIQHAVTDKVDFKWGQEQQ